MKLKPVNIALTGVLSFYCVLVKADLGGTSLAFSMRNDIVSITPISSPNPLSYTVKKIITSDGVEVHEYTDASGVVFGIYWIGEIKPDLTKFLGSYFTRYRTALNNLASGRVPISIADQDFVLQTGGRMNHFFGMSCLPNLLPKGVAVNDIQ